MDNIFVNVTFCCFTMSKVSQHVVCIFRNARDFQNLKSFGYTTVSTRHSDHQFWKSQNLGNNFFFMIVIWIEIDFKVVSIISHVYWDTLYSLS